MTTPVTGPALQQPGDQQQRSRRRLHATVAVSAVVVAVLLAALAIVLIRDNGSNEPGTPPVSSVPPASSTSPSPDRTTTTPPKPTSPTQPTQPTQPPVAFLHQPLWPFTSVADAAAWQAAYRSSGHQPWHLDAGLTARTFTTGYLGFTEIDRVISQSVQGSEAWVAVGYRDPNGHHAVAAVLHLAKIGSGQDAPWEVVGSRDTTLTVEQPVYGAKVGSPVLVGGRITGVDEGIRVDVRQPSTQQPLGTVDGISAGGEHHPWSARVAFHGATDPVLTIVASTGGHLQGVERFAITAVRY
jgi:hypothetical protein